MTAKFKPGMRVISTGWFEKQFPAALARVKKRRLLGTVMPSRSQFVKVKWDDYRTPHFYAESFIVPLKFGEKEPRP